ncbi:MAG: hypothetical protein JWM27_1332 [Gemmatimonadetes bacterium]|nr:hypothetical protein [Gemmatimonadota bacterium]
MVSPENPHVPVEVLREAARLRAQATSQRQAGREIGMSKTGFATFLAGTQPYGPTLVKLRAWYGARNQPGGDVERLQQRVCELEAEVEQLKRRLADRKP